jgi:hypothetical protein
MLFMFHALGIHPSHLLRVRARVLRLDVHEFPTLLDHLALRAPHRPHDARRRCAKHAFRLHALEHDDRLPLLDPVAHRDLHVHDDARHRRAQRARGPAHFRAERRKPSGRRPAEHRVRAGGVEHVDALGAARHARRRGLYDERRLVRVPAERACEPRRRAERRVRVLELYGAARRANGDAEGAVRMRDDVDVHRLGGRRGISVRTGLGLQLEGEDARVDVTAETATGERGPRTRGCLLCRARVLAEDNEERGLREYVRRERRGRREQLVVVFLRCLQRLHMRAEFDGP